MALTQFPFASPIDWSNVFGKKREPVPVSAQQVEDSPNWLEKLMMNEWSADAVKADREWAESQAQKQMDFQKMMSDTSYQRAVADLKAAGLNPALAYMQGGAPSAAGAMATSPSTRQAADLKREDSVIKVIDALIYALGGIVNSAISAALRPTSHTTTVIRR